MRYLALIPLFVLALIPNSQPIDTNVPDNSVQVVSSFLNYTNSWELEFPDRSKQISEAKELDTQREIARLEAIKQAEAIKVAVTPKTTPVVAVNGSCKDWIVAAGVADVENAYWLIMKESGCNPNSVNKSSGACGIPQALPCSKLGTSDPIAQIQWMQNYCVRRYGSWAGAVAHFRNVGWY